MTSAQWGRDSNCAIVNLCIASFLSRSLSMAVSFGYINLKTLSFLSLIIWISLVNLAKMGLSLSLSDISKVIVAFSREENPW